MTASTAIITAGKWTGVLGRGLAPRELEAVLYAASDLTAKETARLMGISPGTVSKRLDDARFKMNCRTVRGLVVEALARGLIFITSNMTPPPRQQHDQECTQGVLVA
jgi:DNA-binding CsgD family transcriptional regulator